MRENLIKGTALALLLCVSPFAFGDEGDGEKAAKPKHTIKEVMKGALKGDALNKKVLSGQATMEEKLMLLDMYVSLVENKAPRGEQASWTKFSGAAALAAAKVAVGREGAMKELKAATKCAACHKAHKPPSQ